MSNPNNGHTTTEELIVSYLDGELVRKELETVLFERLATSEEARLLMREYLTMRGAIHMSRNDERFALTPSIDARTRGRIESMLRSVPALENQPAPELAGFVGDKPAVTSIATTRSMNRWTKRALPTLALLLLAVGTTWYVTRTTVERHDVAMNEQPAKSSGIQTNTIEPAAIPAQQNTSRTELPERTRVVKEYIRVPVHDGAQSSTESPNLAQNAVTTSQQVAPATPTPAAETSDPKDIMISHRFAKAIRGTTAIPVTQQDRL